MSDEFVEVLDISIVTTVPGVILQHTVRPHEGDVQGGDDKDLQIQFGSRIQVLGNEQRTVPGRLVTIPRACAVEVTVTKRWERKVRPSAQMLLDRQKAELEEVKRKLGVADPKS